MQKIIEVSQERIAEGHPNDPYWCPIALAVRQHFPEADRVDVGSESIDVVLPTHTLTTMLPDLAKEFVRLFDDGEQVGPFSFTAGFTVISYSER